MRPRPNASARPHRPGISSSSILSIPSGSAGSTNSLPLGECRVIAFEPCRGCTSSSRSRTLESELKAQVEIKGPECTGSQCAVDLANRLHEAQQTGSRPLFVGENGGSGHQDIGPGAHGQRGRLQVDAAVDFQLTVGVALLQ